MYRKLRGFTLIELLTVVVIVGIIIVIVQGCSEGIRAEAPAEHYAGSNACKDCHQGKYEDWSGRLMSNFVRYVSDISGPLPGNLDNIPTKDERHSIERDDVLLVVGGKRKLAFVDMNWKVYPYQYNLKKNKWKKRNGWVDQDYRQRCAVCHTVGADPEAKTFVELNVGCEVCHGPGRNHADNPVGVEMRVPGRTDGHHVLFTCRQCHNERGNHARAIQDFRGPFHNGVIW